MGNIIGRAASDPNYHVVNFSGQFPHIPPDPPAPAFPHLQPVHALLTAMVLKYHPNFSQRLLAYLLYLGGLISWQGTCCRASLLTSLITYVPESHFIFFVGRMLRVTQQ